MNTQFRFTFIEQCIEWNRRCVLLFCCHFFSSNQSDTTKFGTFCSYLFSFLQIAVWFMFKMGRIKVKTYINAKLTMIDYENSIWKIQYFQYFPTKHYRTAHIHVEFSLWHSIQSLWDSISTKNLDLWKWWCHPGMDLQKRCCAFPQHIALIRMDW